MSSTLTDTPHDSELTFKRRMPDNLRRYLIRIQGGKLYLPAAFRIVWFRDELGDDWSIRTTLVEGGHEAGFATMRAEIVNPDGVVVATGHKTESKQDFPAGWTEKAETGSVARALALLGFGTQFMPELDEGFEVADRPITTGSGSGSIRHPEDAAREANTRDALTWDGEGQCPSCFAPTGKLHTKNCTRSV